MSQAARTPGADDVFEAFNRAQGMGTVADPYPRFAELRRKAPVLEAPMSAFSSAEPAAAAPTWAALSFEAVALVLRDGATFSSAGYARTMGLVMGHTILEMDEPEHHRYRALLNEAFTHARARALGARARAAA